MGDLFTIKLWAQICGRRRLSGSPRETELPSSAHEGVYPSAKCLMTRGFLEDQPQKGTKCTKLISARLEKLELFLSYFVHFVLFCGAFSMCFLAADQEQRRARPPQCEALLD